MNPPDHFPGEDEALVAALAKRVPVPSAVLARLRAERAGLKESETTETKIVTFPSPAALPARRRSWTWMAAAAAIAVLLGFAGYQMWPRTPGSIITRSPAGTVDTTRPEIAWENAPGKKYNVWILPSQGDYTTAPALFVAKGVRSPLPFSALKPGKDTPPDETELKADADYRLLVCYDDAGDPGPGERIAGTPVPFKVAPAPKQR